MTTSPTIVVLLVIVLTLLQLSIQQQQFDDFLDSYQVGLDDHRLRADDIETYLSYDVSISLLEKNSQYCTNFVFPGKSLCNLVITQTYTIDMNLNDTKEARAYSFTPAIPLTNGFQQLDIVSVEHENYHNASFQEDCVIESSIGGKENDGKSKNIKWRISFAAKNYPNPQKFTVTLKAVGAVKPVKATKQNAYVVFYSDSIKNDLLTLLVSLILI
jgi:hypothetical protein